MQDIGKFVKIIEKAIFSSLIFLRLPYSKSRILRLVKIKEGQRGWGRGLTTFRKQKNDPQLCFHVLLFI